MANNITAPAGGTVFATDDVGGVHYPYAKLAFGGEDVAVAVADSSGARLPVQIGGTLPAFAAPPTVNIGTAPTLAVSGPLTDTQLRAAPVPVAFSGQSVSLAGSLPAFAAPPTVNIGTAPTLAVSGPLTDAQLRAAAVPVAFSGQSVSLAGSLPAFAAPPTVNLGTLNGAATAGNQAAANASLASIDGKLAALDSGRTAVAVQTLATTTRSYDYANGQRLTTSGAGPVRSSAITATEILLHASVRGFVRIGDGTVSAAVGAGSIPLAADEKFHLRISSGQFVSFIRDGATDGSLTIMPVA